MKLNPTDTNLAAVALKHQAQRNIELAKKAKRRGMHAAARSFLTSAKRMAALSLKLAR